MSTLRTTRVILAPEMLATRLKKGEADASEDEAQLRLHSAAAGCFGVLASGNSHRAETARDALRACLRRRRGR